MAGDLARLRILTRMQGNPAKKILNAREESNLKRLGDFKEDEDRSEGVV